MWNWMIEQRNPLKLQEWMKSRNPLKAQEGGEEHDDTEDSNGPDTESECFEHAEEVSRAWAHENDPT